MELEQFLHLNGAGLNDLVHGAGTIVPLSRGGRLIAVGSLAEGLGNARSDIDLIFIPPRGTVDRASRSERSFVVGTCVVDLRIVPIERVTGLRQRLSRWARRDWTLADAADFSGDERLLLHRLSAGRTLWPTSGGDRGGQSIARDDIAKLKLHVARHLARTLQVDMAGYRDEDDHQSLIYAAQDLLGHVIDALLAGYHLTNPTPKWRSRLLERLPADWERRLPIHGLGLTAGQMMWQFRQVPPEPTAAAALHYAHRIVAFGRAVFFWAEHTLVHRKGNAGCEDQRRGRRRGTGAMTDPLFDIDVDFMLGETGATVGRLNTFGATLAMSLDDFASLSVADSAMLAGIRSPTDPEPSRGGATGRNARIALEVRRLGLGAVTASHIAACRTS